jgi:hypothetical protein
LPFLGVTDCLSILCLVLLAFPKCGSTFAIGFYFTDAIRSSKAVAFFYATGVPKVSRYSLDIVLQVLHNITKVWNSVDKPIGFAKFDTICHKASFQSMVVPSWKTMVIGS